jgi:hypothetical protein
MNNFEQCDIHTVDALPILEQICRSSEWSGVVQGKIESPPYFLVSVSQKGGVGKALLGLQRYSYMSSYHGSGREPSPKQRRSSTHGFRVRFFFGPYRGPTRRPVVPYVLLLGVVMQLPKYDGAGRAVMVPG